MRLFKGHKIKIILKIYEERMNGQQEEKKLLKDLFFLSGIQSKFYVKGVESLHKIIHKPKFPKFLDKLRGNQIFRNKKKKKNNTRSEIHLEQN